MGRNAQTCTSCGETGTFRGEVCRPCRRKALNDASDFTENTVRTNLLFNNGWMVSNTWRVVYVACGLCALWFGRDVAKHTEYVALPIGLLVVSLSNQVMQSRRYYIPRSFQRLSAATLRIGVHAQMIAFTSVMGIAGGQVASHMGYDAWLRNPLTMTEGLEAARTREAADGFPQQVPAIKAQLASIDGLIEKSNLTLADARLHEVESQMDPVLHSYAKAFADVVAVQKLVSATREHIVARRQSLAVNDAMSQMENLNRRIDMIDHELSRNRCDLASHLWVKVERDIEDVPNPAAALSRDIELAKSRLEKQRDAIRRGFTRQVGQTTAATKPTKKHGTRAMASVDP